MSPKDWGQKYIWARWYEFHLWLKACNSFRFFFNVTTYPCFLQCYDIYNNLSEY